MRSTFAAIVAFQALVASAMPGFLEQRQNGRCNADNCLRQVRNTKSLARGSADCQAYFGVQAVTPCPVTVSGTSTSVVTSTVATITVTTDTVTVTEIATSIELSTVTTTSTINLAKRELERCPSTQTTNAPIPAYASSCSAGTRYSSACSCLGVTAGGLTTTLPAATVTSGATTVSSTTSVTVTFYTATSTTVSSTTTVTSTTTTTVTSTNAPACQTYAITLDGVNPAGTGNNFNRDFTTGTVTLGEASPLWYLQLNGKLTPLENEGQGIVLSQFESSGQPFDRMNVDSDPQPKNLQCNVIGGTLNCSGSNGTEDDASDEFYVCPDYTASQFYASGPGTLYISDGTDVPSDCTRIYLTATAQC